MSFLAISNWERLPPQVGKVFCKDKKNPLSAAVVPTFFSFLICQKDRPTLLNHRKIFFSLLYKITKSNYIKLCSFVLHFEEFGEAWFLFTYTHFCSFCLSVLTRVFSFDVCIMLFPRFLYFPVKTLQKVG